MLPYAVFVSIGLLPQLIGVAPEKAIKLTVRIFWFFFFLLSSLASFCLLTCTGLIS